jgi:NADPH-dependent 2,4-dienoyl-CoA reductase/sulfur reductase-like enzyme
VALAVQELHESHGVTFRLSAKISAVEGVGDQKALVLDNGEEIQADLVLGGIGVTPNVDLAVAGGLRVYNGILVDAYGQSSVPDIFAAGDVTNHFNPVLGRYIRLESWQNAQNQALAVAGVLCGESAAYAEIPWLWSDQYNLNLQYAGLPTGSTGEIIRGAPESGTFSIFSTLGARVIAVCGFNAPKDVAIGKRLIAGAQEIDSAKLADTGFDLRKAVAR